VQCGEREDAVDLEAPSRRMQDDRGGTAGLDLDVGGGDSGQARPGGITIARRRL
jgi:hypothetical protein